MGSGKRKWEGAGKGKGGEEKGDSDGRESLGDEGEGKKRGREKGRGGKI